MTWILAAALTRPARGEASGRSHLASTLSPSRLHVTGLYWQQCGRLGRPPGKLGGARARHRARPATARAGGDTGWRPPGGWSAVFAACGHRFSQPSARGGNRLWRFTRSSEFRTTDSRRRCAPPPPPGPPGPSRPGRQDLRTCLRLLPPWRSWRNGTASPSDRKLGPSQRRRWHTYGAPCSSPRHGLVQGLGAAGVPIFSPRGRPPRRRWHITLS